MGSQATFVPKGGRQWDIARGSELEREFSYGVVRQLARRPPWFIAGQSNGDRYVVTGWESREACDRALEKFLPVAGRLGLSDSDVTTEEFEIRDQQIR
jgi:hypothetical protein